MRLGSQLSGMNRHGFSTGLSWGHPGGGGSVILAGATSAADPCHAGLIEDQDGMGPRGRNRMSLCYLNAVIRPLSSSK